MSDILVSYVVTVYNKEAYVGHTVKSLLTQEGGIPSEYIFVDDVSTDRSLEVIAEAARGAPNVAIIRNTRNMGPSVRLNQGARLARGTYLQFIDSDDVLAANATKLMLRLMEEHGADVVHGHWERIDQDGMQLVGRKVVEDAPYKISDAPMAAVFEERMRRMAQMVRREIFLEAGGCDERVFVQDESLGLRLARVARRLILLSAPVLIIPKIEGELSRNVSQLNHDRFLAAYDMLLDFPDLDATARRKLYQRCVSATWKQRRLMSGPLALATPAFLRYVRAKWSLPEVDRMRLEEMRRFFAGLEGVRRVASES